MEMDGNEIRRRSLQRPGNTRVRRESEREKKGEREKNETLDG